jgi:hypothetical protein
MGKYIVAAFVLIIIIAGGLYWWNMKGTAAPAPAGPQPSQQMATSTYATSTYSVVYPSNFSADTGYQYTEVPNKPIAGVKFTIPGSMATGTNLSADSYVSIETLPRAKICTGDIYLPTDVKSETITDTNGIEYSLATSSDAGAGNFYEEQVYALPNSSPCTAVRYWIHSTDIGNYTPGTVQAFDEQALLSAFDTIRHSLTLGATQAPMIPAPTTTTQ